MFFKMIKILIFAFYLIVLIFFILLYFNQIIEKKSLIKHKKNHAYVIFNYDILVS